jgi:hypothetical protein
MPDPIGTLQETRLWTYLAEIDQPLAHDAMELVSKVAPLLDTVQEHFPYFTRHDVLHSSEVANKIASVVNPYCLEAGSPVALSGTEAFLLLAAAYTHDLGMAILPDEAALWKRPPCSSPFERSRYLRDRHAQRGSLYVAQNGWRLGISRTFLEPLGEMIPAHNLTVGEVRQRLRKPRWMIEQQIDLRQLTCLFCIADALQLGQTRVIDGVMERINADANPFAVRSYYENMMQLGIGDGVTVQDDGRITISGRFPDPDVGNWAQQSIDRIDSWVRDYGQIAARSSRPLLRISSDRFICRFSAPLAGVLA